MCGRLQVGAQIPHRRKIFFVGGQSIPSPLRRHVPWFTDLLNGEYPTEDSYLAGDRSDMAACCQYCSNLFFSFYPSLLIDGNYVSKVEIVQLCPQSCCLRKTAGHTDKPVKTTFSEIKSQ